MMMDKPPPQSVAVDGIALEDDDPEKHPANKFKPAFIILVDALLLLVLLLLLDAEVLADRNDDDDELLLFC